MFHCVQGCIFLTRISFSAGMTYRRECLFFALLFRLFHDCVEATSWKGNVIYENGKGNFELPKTRP